jgi:diguanylate cyclase (GGDEF)-like protein/PAS domain S-box-containing protein
MSRLAAGGVWKLVVESLPDGAVLTDARRPDQPVIYVNPAFERMTGYASDELVGRNLRVLQGDATRQPGLRRLGDAIAAGLETRATVQNFRKDGESFWMDVHIVPVRDGDGTLTHWVSVHRETEARGPAEDRATGGFRAVAPELLPRQDPLTGFRTATAFEEMLDHRLSLAVREKHALALFLVRIDDFERYTDTFDRAAGDALLKRVARAVGGCFRRSSDVLGRQDEDGLAVLTGAMTTEQMESQGRAVCARVAALGIHHPHSRYRRYVTLSVGVAGGVPAAGATVANLVALAREALDRAHKEGDAARVTALPAAAD